MCLLHINITKFHTRRDNFIADKPSAIASTLPATFRRTRAYAKIRRKDSSAGAEVWVGGWRQR